MAKLVYDNIFDAITDNPEEAHEFQTRADLMVAIRDIIDERGLKQTEAAEMLCLTQPRVSDLKNGKIDKFSIDLLMTCLFRLGFHIKPKYEKSILSFSVEAA